MKFKLYLTAGCILAACFVVTAHGVAQELCGQTRSNKLVGGPSCLDTTGANGEDSRGVQALNACLLEKLNMDLDDVNTRLTTKKIVAGLLYSSEITYDNAKGSEETCTVKVYEQPWLSTAMCSVECDGKNIGDKVNIIDKLGAFQNEAAQKSKEKIRLNSDDVDAGLKLGLSSGGVMRGQLDLGAAAKRNIIKRSVDIVERMDHATLSMGKDGILDVDVKNIFDEFIVKFNRTYRENDNSNTYGEKLKVFANNLNIVQELNRLEKGSAIYGITKFMDYSAEEYKKYLAPGFTESLAPIPEAELSALNLNDIPTNVDWREKGAVTDVKNQGMCGSCWAFSTTGNVEGQYAIKHGKLLSLSEQELVDCDTLDAGCNGGLPSNAYKSIETLGGLEAESDYPYDGKDETCNINKSEVKVTVSGGVTLPEDEALLAAWVAQNGPVSIGINANLMQFYWGGVSHPWKIFCNPQKLDHGVLIVGYGVDEKKNEPYWLIKNSWGPDWGEDGYYRIYRGDGSCGVNLMATSAVVD